MGKQKEGGKRERKKVGGERYSIDGNRVPAQRENQGEKWMDCMLGKDWTEAIDDQRKVCEGNQVFVT